MKKLVTLITMLILSTSSLFAGELTGKQIIEKVYNRPTPKSQEAVLTMTLINKQGKKRIRKIKQISKDFGDVEKKIMFFMSPADVKNTSFMNWSYDKKGKSDDQWIYLPVVKKVKRISSDSKSDYFMGSDFTYDDLGDRKLDADIHKFLRQFKPIVFIRQHVIFKFIVHRCIYEERKKTHNKINCHSINSRDCFRNNLELRTHRSTISFDETR